MKNKLPVLALAGQPNCGKSTLFNAVAGFKVNTGNFAGTTVSYVETQVQFEGTSFTLIDLPGTYSITSLDAAEKVTRDYLLSGNNVDVIINVVDTSMLSRSLEFTQQLMEMRVPMIVVLNMIDESERKGMTVDLAAFKRLTGLEAVPVVAVRGEGIDDAFRAALRLTQNQAYTPVPPVYDRDVEDCLAQIIARYPDSLRQRFPVDERFVAIRLLEMDEEFESEARRLAPDFAAWLAETRRELAQLHNWPESDVFSSHRHANVLNLYERVAKHQRRPRVGMRERADSVMMNPVGGILAVLGSIILMFSLAFGLGDFLSGLLSSPFASLHAWVATQDEVLVRVVLTGLVQGVEAGVGIVLPYLVPLLFLLSLFEDTGLLPRVAFMVDGILHRFGLHGKAVMPMILGYGCTVPALMATRNLENSRDRFVTRMIVPFISCSARTVVILGLVGKFLGPLWVAVLYFGNLGVTLLVSFVLSRFKVDLSYGLIMDVPPLRRPYLGLAFKKVWLRLSEFLVLGFPVVLVSSVVLSVLSLYGIDQGVNQVLSPLTAGVLKLPVAVGITLFLGVFRKELALVMLIAALGVADLGSVLSRGQIFVLTSFIVLYIPCIASLATLWKEGGWRTAGASAALSFGVAVLVAGGLAQFLVR